MKHGETIELCFYFDHPELAWSCLWKRHFSPPNTFVRLNMLNWNCLSLMSQTRKLLYGAHDFCYSYLELQYLTIVRISGIWLPCWGQQSRNRSRHGECGWLHGSEWREMVRIGERPVRILLRLCSCTSDGIPAAAGHCGLFPCSAVEQLENSL